MSTVFVFSPTLPSSLLLSYIGGSLKTASIPIWSLWTLSSLPHEHGVANLQGFFDTKFITFPFGRCTLTFLFNETYYIPSLSYALLHPFLWILFTMFKTFKLATRMVVYFVRTYFKNSTSLENLLWYWKFFIILFLRLCNWIVWFSESNRVKPNAMVLHLQSLYWLFSQTAWYL